LVWYAAKEWPANRDHTATQSVSIVAARPPLQSAPPVVQATVRPTETGRAKFLEPLKQSGAASEEAWGANAAPISTAASFVYVKNHPATPVPALAFAAMTSGEPMNADEFGPTFMLPEKPIDAGPGQLRVLSRDGLCSAIVAVAKANDLPTPFFANLIWQESSFRLKTISRAGALGIAQFIPETAVEHGLMNPFEPVHALFASGRLLRKLNQQFGNLGLAAAAYNAGPQRVYDWIGARRGLPAETRAYVARITGHRAERWLSSEFRRGPEAMLMPARAPCAEVAEEVKTQTHFVRVAKLMLDLAEATAPPPPQSQARIAALPSQGAKLLPQAKPAKPRNVTTQASPVKPVARVRVADTMKDQSRAPAGRESAKPSRASTSAEVRHVAAQ
jgi:soluble lytic murein transglycosylase-like protein